MADKLIPGGTTSINDLTSVDKGVYAAFPAGTPKYHAGNGPESVYKQARIYTTVPPTLYAAYREAVPQRAQGLLDVLCTTSGIGSIGIVDLFITQINDNYSEKVQVSEVLSDAHVAYFFGQRAVTYQISGMLLNTQQDNWYSAFHVLYQDLIRGTKTATHGADLTLKYDDRRIVGSMTNFSTNLNSAVETAVSFNLQMLVREIIIDRPVRATLRAQAGFVLDLGEDAITAGNAVLDLGEDVITVGQDVIDLGEETVIAGQDVLDLGEETLLVSSAEDVATSNAVARATQIAASVRAGANTDELSQAYGVDLAAVYAAASAAVLSGAGAFSSERPVLGGSNLDQTRGAR